jgi:hypothetical protein
MLIPWRTCHQSLYFGPEVIMCYHCPHVYALLCQMNMPTIACLVIWKSWLATWEAAMDGNIVLQAMSEWTTTCDEVFIASKTCSWHDIFRPSLPEPKGQDRGTLGAVPRSGGALWASSRYLFYPIECTYMPHNLLPSPGRNQLTRKDVDTSYHCVIHYKRNCR